MERDIYLLQVIHGKSAVFFVKQYFANGIRTPAEPLLNKANEELSGGK